MSEFLILAVILVGIVSAIEGTIFLVFRRGLAVRIFLVVVPAMAVIAYCGFSLGKIGLQLLPTVLLCSLGTLIGVSSLSVLYRMVVASTREQMNQLVAITNQISSTAKQAAATASEQAAVVAQVSTTVSEINQTSQAVSSAAQQVVEKATSAVEQGRRGEEAVAEAARIMDLVGEVVEVVETVGDLAEQSNLLAVNASIEAAKAGAHGRGFSVVASEVRNLAEQSKIATQQIRAAIKKVEEGKRAIDTTMTIVKRLSAVLDESSDAARQISGATNEQAAGIAQINDSMSNVAQGGKDTAAGAQELQSAVLQLNKIAVGLHKLVTGRVLAASY